MNLTAEVATAEAEAIEADERVAETQVAASSDGAAITVIPSDSIARKSLQEDLDFDEYAAYIKIA